MIPVGLVSSLSNLQNLVKLLPFLEPLLSFSPTFMAILQGVLPSLALAVFMSVLPILLMYLAKIEGIDAFSLVSESVLDRFFWFQIVNVFFGVTFSTGTFSVLQELIERPASLSQILGESVPAASTFFVNYVCLQALAVFP
eukprot:CAMPEP_0173107620 /NCGR_PEP_ID=MMETSP1102-20130122/41959_1 /TAXON_ID=49646 /ORGANISM="Geminigera sp., Strain Caron Lab Isolate" /LENGTH=140 /DNA_ID=CAMNT_0014005391 /DNA_START=219 /DNA_END=637 /DNA_ORIENTATION=+